MKICKTVSDIRKAVADLRSDGDTIALVPTMGFLHDGHMALVDRAARSADRVVVSIFVNPTQFENSDDLATYPRDSDRDLAMLRAANVDLVFMPDAAEVYPAGTETIVETTRMANMLHGLVRPGHFRGVATVVTKLFNIVQPDFALFGEKDFQQLQVIRRMVTDLFLPLAIIGVPTVREADGLAMSSRNVRLTPEDRAAATVLNAALCLAEQLVRDGTTADALHDAVATHIRAEPRASLGAVDICMADDLSPVAGQITTPVALMISAEFGGILLIDQRVATP